MRICKWLTLLILGILIFSLGVSPAAAQSIEKVQVLIGFTQKPGPAEQALVRGAGGEIGYTYSVVPAIAASIPERAIPGLLRNPKITHIEADSLAYAIGETLPWGVDRIDAEVVQDTGNTGKGVKVAIVDTGIQLDHGDLHVLGGANFVGGVSSYADDNGHGTHCAGIVAALDNEIGVIGVAPEAELYAVKVLNSSGSGYYSQIIAGIEWCITNGIQVISMSLGGSTSSIDLENACKAAYDAGIIVVASAGNEGNPPGRGDNISYPARYSSVIAVAATDQDDSRAKWSSTGPAAELSAPGVSIYSTYLNNGYATMSGTSMACPHVSGVAALVKASDSSLTNIRVREILRATADDLGATGWDEYYGYGLVDAEEAALGQITPPPPPPTTGVMHIEDVTVTYITRQAGKNYFYTGIATITVLDSTGSPVEGVTVSGKWDGLTVESDYGITDADGVVVLSSESVKSASGTFMFTVDSLVKSDWDYDPGADLENSDSISLP